MSCSGCSRSTHWYRLLWLNRVVYIPNSRSYQASSTPLTAKELIKMWVWIIKIKSLFVVFSSRPCAAVSCWLFEIALGFELPQWDNLLLKSVLACTVISVKILYVLLFVTSNFIMPVTFIGRHASLFRFRFEILLDLIFILGIVILPIELVRLS